MIFIINLLSISCCSHSILKYFCLPSLWSHVGTWKSSLLGATSTGTWPMRASSTCGTSSTCPRRSCPPPSAAKPAQRPPDPVPRVRWSSFPHLTSFNLKCFLFFTFMMFQTHELVHFKSISKTLLNQTWCFSGLEGERPARLARGEGDRDAYRRSAAPRTYTIHTVDISIIISCGLCAALLN